MNHFNNKLTQWMTKYGNVNIVRQIRYSHELHYSKFAKDQNSHPLSKMWSLVNVEWYISHNGEAWAIENVTQINSNSGIIIGETFTK